MKRTFVLVWSMLLLVLVSIDMGAQSTKGWDYPIKPGTEDWLALSTHNEMVEACQIPAEVLSAVTTEELLELCLDYPLLGDIYAYNGLQEGVRKVSISFNGLQELLNRNDNASLLLDKMKKQNQLNSGVLTLLEIGKELTRQMAVESLLSNEMVLSNASRALQVDISFEAVKKVIYRQNNLEINGLHGLKTASYLLGRSLEQIDGDAFTPELKQFIADGVLTNINVIKELLKYYTVTINKLRL